MWAWLNITPEMSGTWVNAHLEAYSTGEESFSMASKHMIMLNDDAR